MAKREDPFAFSNRNNMDGIAIFELGDLRRLPYCMAQVSESGWCLLNRDYYVLPEGTHRLSEVDSAVAHHFEQDPRTFEGVWVDATGRYLYLWDTQFEEAHRLHERLQRLQMYRAGCTGRT